MTVPERVRTADPSRPAPNKRLNLGTIAAALRVTITEMSQATGISRTGVSNILMNTWPVHCDPEVIKAQIELLLVERGATKAQLATLWHSVGPGKRSVDSARRELAAAGRPISESDPETKDTDMLLPKQTLTREAMRHFAIFANPFDGEVTNDEQMFSSPEIAYVREACLQAALGGRFVAITAESGAGKTTIMGDLEARIARDSKQVIVFKPSVLGMEDSDRRGKSMKSADILAAIITTLDPLVNVPQTLEARSTKARELLIRSVEAGFLHLLMIEEAHSMPDATLKHLKRLHEMRLGRKPLLGILLLGQTELGMRLDPRRANLREVTQRCEVVQLMPLDTDLQDYLAHKAKLANKPLDHFIADDGVEEIRARLTVTRPAPGGKQRATSLLYPLAVNNLMTAAMNVAADLGVPVITRDVVRGV